MRDSLRRDFRFAWVPLERVSLRADPGVLRDEFVRDNPGMPEPLTAEDKKLVTLARATRARIQAAEGAALRDTDGRTYAAATVALPSLQLSAVQACVAMAVASGSSGVDACVVLGDSGIVSEADAGVLTDFAGAGGVLVHVGDPRGAVSGTMTFVSRES